MKDEALNPYPQATRFRRSPDDVMRLVRMGSFHPTRLSFLRVLLRRVARDRWRFERPLWRVDERGVGRALYCVHGPERSYTLVCFAHDLPFDQRSDRVIATAWDATFTLFDGVPEAAALDRLEANVPLQEAGRVSPCELSLSRANRSVRLFEHVVARLAAGLQPDAVEIDSVGYLMRTTAVYGSGKFGAADHASLANRPELRGSFQVEMLVVWLIRAFTVDIVEHLARVRGGAGAARLQGALKRRLGVGNSTGLGMAPFLINHPVLLNNWMMAREEALARVRNLPEACETARADFEKALAAALDNAQRWHSAHPLQRAKLASLHTDLAALEQQADALLSRAVHPWEHLWQWGRQHLSLEGQEALVALMLEPHGSLIDALADCMSADEEAANRIDGAMALKTLARQISHHYHWALGIDYEQPEHSARFWYTSEEKQEPRLGERLAEPGAEREQPLAIGRDVQRLMRALHAVNMKGTVAELLLTQPEHRHVVRRVQRAARYPFAEIHDNLIGAEMRPIDLLRCKLSFFGASRFDPRSDRWVRICLFADEPYPDELLGPS